MTFQIIDNGRRYEVRTTTHEHDFAQVEFIPLDEEPSDSLEASEE